MSGLVEILEMKHVQLEVVPIRDQGEIVFSQLGIRHVGCVGPLEVRKQHRQTSYSARCTCGLDLVFSNQDQSTITRTAIDLEARTLGQSGITVVASATR